MTDIKDRARGALVGLAVGDAVGTTLEFKERGEFEPITDMVGGGPFRLQPGQWTDDTSMALCLADSLIAHDVVDHEDLLARFLAWYEQGTNSVTGRCFDIGTTTREALMAYKARGYEPAPNRPHLAGNGSIMRLAPVAIRWCADDMLARVSAREQSLTTHGSDEALKGCDTLVGMITRGIRGEDQELNTRIKDVNQDLIESSGYVVHTMMAAQWAVLNTDNFRDAILKAANLGDDADTVAAVAGQIAGSLYGMTGIPSEWLDKLAWRDHIVELADTLFQRSPLAGD